MMDRALKQLFTDMFIDGTYSALYLYGLNHLLTHDCMILNRTQSIRLDFDFYMAISEEEYHGLVERERKEAIKVVKV